MKKHQRLFTPLAILALALTIPACGGGGGGGGGGEEENTGYYAYSSEATNSSQNNTTNQTESGYAPASLIGKTLCTQYSFNSVGVSSSNAGVLYPHQHYVEWYFGNSFAMWYLRIDESIAELAGSNSWSGIYKGDYTYSKTGPNTGRVTINCDTNHYAAIDLTFTSPNAATGSAQLSNPAGGFTLNITIK